MKGIDGKISTAKSKYELIKQIGIPDEINTLLNELKFYISEANKERRSIGMSEICFLCGTKEVPCCGSGIELKYSSELLLVNMLFGVHMPQGQEFVDRCFFLKKNGCCLFARDVFCINFVCNKIQEKLSINHLKRLRYFEGKQLNLQFIIEEKLKKLFS